MKCGGSARVVACIAISRFIVRRNDPERSRGVSPPNLPQVDTRLQAAASIGRSHRHEDLWQLGTHPVGVLVACSGGVPCPRVGNQKSSRWVLPPFFAAPGHVCLSRSLDLNPLHHVFSHSHMAGRTGRVSQEGHNVKKKPFVAVMPSFIPPPPPPRQHCLRCSPAHAPPQGGHLFFGVCAKAKKKQGRAGVGGARGCVEQLTPPSDASPDGSCNNKWKKGQKENKNMRFNPAGICSLARRGNDDDELSLQCVHHAYNVRHVLLTRAAVDHLQSPLGLRSHACCREPHRDKERPAHDPVRALG